jgi:PhnB protein
MRPTFPAVIPCIRAEGAPDILEFLTDALGAEVEDATYDPSGRLAYAVARLGEDSVVEVSEPNERFGPMTAAIHLYVADVDALHRAALAHVARELYAPAEMPYRERSSGLEDPSGNHWYLATYTGPE